MVQSAISIYKDWYLAALNYWIHASHVNFSIIPLRMLNGVVVARLTASEDHEIGIILGGTHACIMKYRKSWPDVAKLRVLRMMLMHKVLCEAQCSFCMKR
jgi:hypothetical protein